MRKAVQVASAREDRQRLEALVEKERREAAAAASRAADETAELNLV